MTSIRSTNWLHNLPQQFLGNDHALQVQRLLVTGLRRCELLLRAARKNLQAL